MHESIVYRPIGVVRSPIEEIEGAPIQPRAGKGIRATIELDREYEQGLRDLDGFSHIVLLYHFHLSKAFSLEVTPFLDDKPRGVFATRAPRRPNPIGLSVVRLVGIEGRVLHIEDVDMLDGTLVLDIKPYIRELEPSEEVRLGWLEGKSQGMDHVRADDRFK
jgi:tRNA (adenine37-N6)-methyltransferase